MQTEPFADWDQFILRLVKHFTGLTTATLLHCQLKSCHQNTDQLPAYYARFQRIVAVLLRMKLQYPDNVLIDYFIKGLNPSYAVKAQQYISDRGIGHPEDDLLGSLQNYLLNWAAQLSSADHTARVYQMSTSKVRRKEPSKADSYHYNGRRRYNHRKSRFDKNHRRGMIIIHPIHPGPNIKKLIRAT